MESKSEEIMINIEENKKVLIVGASGDLGFAVLEMLAKFNIKIGVHCFHNKLRLEEFSKLSHKADIKILKGSVSSQSTSGHLVKNFVKWAGGIDYLVQMSGDISGPKSWEILTQKEWEQDLAVNLSGPFFLAQEAVKYMKKSGGKIIFTSTASAAHGGAGNSLAYGVAKAGIECMTKGLARGCAKYNVLVNAVAPGFIQTKFHTDRMNRTKRDLKKRAQLVPLKRSGHPKDVAGMVCYLLSSLGNFITGEIIPISGGDWL